jgi:hypothetical protein
MVHASMICLQVFVLLWCTILVHGHCPSSGQTLTASSGLITDGSGSYLNRESCNWIIAPSGANSVTLSFSLFETESSFDLVRVYSCLNTLCDSTWELGSSPFSGFSVPLNITSNTGIMKVVFTTDGSTIYSGFTANYVGTIVLKTSSACPTGQYTGSFGGCYPCSNRPINSFYTSSGGTSSIGCTWQCDYGYHKTNDEACLYGSVTSRSRCSTGQYVNSYGGCSLCKNKPNDAHYISNGEASSDGCSWICDDGYVSDGSRCHATPGAIQETVASKAVKGVTSVFGLFLLIPILVIAVILRAKDDSVSSAAANQHLQNQCCICLTTFNSRRIVMAASGALAALTLIFTIAADAQVCRPGSKLGLAATAYFFHFVGGIASYSVCSCGCSLCTPACCQFSRGVCNRTVQAASALGFSIGFWVVAQLVFIYNLIFLGFAESFRISESYSGQSSKYADPDYDCPYEAVSLSMAPPGLVSIAGIFNASALVLQGHFVSLVPEALAAAATRGPETAPAQTPPRAGAQAPPHDNSQFNVLSAHVFESDRVQASAESAPWPFPAGGHAVPAVPSVADLRLGIPLGQAHGSSCST